MIIKIHKKKFIISFKFINLDLNWEKCFYTRSILVITRGSSIGKLE
jgi:hypothetical protein